MKLASVYYLSLSSKGKREYDYLRIARRPSLKRLKSLDRTALVLKVVFRLVSSG